MKTKIYVGMMASVLFLTAFSTFAGTRHGGGGMGILCGDRLRTLDLWEAEEVRGLTAGPEFSTLEENQAFYHLRLVQYFRQGAPNPELEEKLAQALVESSFRVLGVRQIEKGTDDLPRSEDADLYEVPPGCVVVQVAYMNDLTGVLKLNSTYFDRLSYRDQTALILHEIIYKLLRVSREHMPNSDQTRQFVGELFSAAEPRGMFVETQSRVYGVCGWADTIDTQYNLVVYEGVEQGVRGLGFIIMRWFGKFQISPIKAFIPGASVSDVMSGKEFFVDRLVFKDRYGKSYFTINGTRIRRKNVQGHDYFGMDVKLFSDSNWHSAFCSLN